MKNKVVILMFVFMAIIIALLSVICFILVFKNDDNKKSTKPKEKTKTIEERLKETFLAEGYEEVLKNQLRKTIKENDGTGCLEREEYNFDLKIKEFNYGYITEINNECVSISVTYDIAIDTGYYAYTRRPKDSYTLVFNEHTSESYDFNTGANNCIDDCFKIKQFKNELISLLKKHDISIDEIK